MIPKTYRRVVLSRRPPGEPTDNDFRIEELPTPEPRANEVLVRVIYLSLDPTCGDVCATKRPMPSRWASAT